MTVKRHDPSYQSTISKLIHDARASFTMSHSELARKSGVSASHLVRVERGERFPSGQVLKKIAEPLGFKEDELMALAGYMTPPEREEADRYGDGRLDPDVEGFLAQEPIAVQRAAIMALRIVKNLAKANQPRQETS